MNLNVSSEGIARGLNIILQKGYKLSIFCRIVDTRDILLGIIGFGISFYGGFQESMVLVVTGILMIMLGMYLRIQELDETVSVIKAQINTQQELQKIWREIKNLQENGRKKR